MANVGLQLAAQFARRDSAPRVAQFDRDKLRLNSQDEDRRLCQFRLFVLLQKGDEDKTMKRTREHRRGNIIAATTIGRVVSRSLSQSRSGLPDGRADSRRFARFRRSINVMRAVIAPSAEA